MRHAGLGSASEAAALRFSHSRYDASCSGVSNWEMIGECSFMHLADARMAGAAKATAPPSLPAAARKERRAGKARADVGRVRLATGQPPRRPESPSLAAAQAALCTSFVAAVLLIPHPS